MVYILHRVGGFVITRATLMSKDYFEQFAVCSVHLSADWGSFYSTHCTSMHHRSIMRLTIWHTLVCSVQCAVCSEQCAVCSVQCAVCSVQCAVCSVPLRCVVIPATVL